MTGLLKLAPPVFLKSKEAAERLRFLDVGR